MHLLRYVTLRLVTFIWVLLRLVSTTCQGILRLLTKTHLNKAMLIYFICKFCSESGCSAFFDPWIWIQYSGSEILDKHLGSHFRELSDSVLR
jgi:hypothetical protein